MKGILNQMLERYFGLYRKINELIKEIKSNHVYEIFPDIDLNFFKNISWHHHKLDFPV